MRAMLVVEGLELTERVEQVSLVPDQHAVQEFTAAGLGPTAPSPRSSWASVPRDQRPDAGIGQDGVEQAGGLAVAAADQVSVPDEPVGRSAELGSDKYSCNCWLRLFI